MEELGVDQRAQMEPPDLVTAEQVYEHRWASTLLEHVLFDGQLQDARATPPELLTLFPAPDQLAPSPSVAP
jgi:hypothetical protein